MAGAVKDTGTDTFDQDVLQGDTLAVVDIWAPWCGPCRMLSPVVEQLATEYAGRVRFFKLNADEHNEMAGRFGVRSIPTLLVFKGGEVVDRRVGFDEKSKIKAFIDRHLAG